MCDQRTQPDRRVDRCRITQGSQPSIELGYDFHGQILSLLGNVGAPSNRDQGGNSLHAQVRRPGDAILNRDPTRNTIESEPFGEDVTKIELKPARE